MYILLLSRNLQLVKTANLPYALVCFTVYLTALFVLGILPMLQYSAYLPSLVCLVSRNLQLVKTANLPYALVCFTVYLTALFVLGILPMLQSSAYLPSLVCFALCLTLLFVLHFALEPLCKSYRSA